LRAATATTRPVPVSGVRVKYAKKIRAVFPRKEQMGALGQYAAEMMRDRVLKTQRDANGRRMPSLKSGSWGTTKSDPRLKGSKSTGRPSGTALGGDGHVVRGSGEPIGLFWEGGFAEVKRADGAKGVSDGKWTGRMWGGLTASVTLRKGRKVVRIHFTGKSPTLVFRGRKRRVMKSRATADKYITVGGKSILVRGRKAQPLLNEKGRKRTEVVNVNRSTVTNQEKADAFQRRGPSGDRKKTAQFQLLGFSAKEMAVLAKRWRQVWKQENR